MSADNGIYEFDRPLILKKVSDAKTRNKIDDYA